MSTLHVPISLTTKQVSTLLTSNVELSVDQDMTFSYGELDKDGLKHGEHRVFSMDKDRKIYCSAINNYKNGKADGKQQTFSENGQITAETNYVDGVPHGLQQAWYKNGQLMYTYTADKGKKHGKQRAYYPDGQLEKLFNYFQGQQHGEQREWHPNGQLKTCKTSYKNGKLYGSFKQWYDNGKIEIDADYVADKRHGSSKAYAPGGQLYHEENYIDGQLHGKCRYWFNGTSELAGDYVGGKRHGKLIFYRDNGTISSERMYENDKPHGLNKYYDENGKITSIEFQHGNHIKDYKRSLRRVQLEDRAMKALGFAKERDLMTQNNDQVNEVIRRNKTLRNALGNNG